MRTETVTSAQNPKIKELLALQEKSRLRRERGLFVVEGRRELGHCIEAGYRVRTIFVCREIIPGTEADAIIWKAETVSRKGQSDGLLVIDIPSALYDKVAYRGGTEGIIAEVEWKDLSLGGLHLTGNPLIMVLESVEKPGNLGAVLRSADAAGADAVIVCDPLTDLGKHRGRFLKAGGGRIVRRHNQMAEKQEHTNPYGSASGLKILL